LNVDARCTGISVSCGAVIGFVTPILSLALGTVAFLSWRFIKVRRWYQRRARKLPRDLVPTAGTITGRVVGRDELCHVLMEDLHDRPTCRPHVLIGGVGTGKTAVLVRLTELLAGRGAVPVPIQLRNTDESLDFTDLASKRFLDEIDPLLGSRAEGEKIWRRLLRDGRIVVLADGLEEALITADQDRDNVIRLAIRRAHEERLPLFITSRPHDPLRGMDAAIAQLESLSEEAALAYVDGDRSRDDERRLDWIVETAAVAEAPLYLQITRQLYGVRRLHHLSPGQRGLLDTRSNDRSTLRLWLLATWEDALIHGYLHADIPLSMEERTAALDRLSALAWSGLLRDQLEVSFDAPIDGVEDEVDRRLSEAAGKDQGLDSVDTRLAATWGSQLGLVETRGKVVRFPHSLMQAYLGSRLMDAALSDPRHLETALAAANGPGRELLIALVLHSRTSRTVATGTSPPDLTAVRDALTRAALRCDNNKALDMYSAALEIDCVSESPQQIEIAKQIDRHWPRIRARDSRTLEEGKLGLVHRFGDALRVLDGRRRTDRRVGDSAYAQLYVLSCREPSYPIRLAAAQEIGAGGEAAYRQLEPILTAPCEGCERKRAKCRVERVATEELDDNARWRARLMSAWLAPLLVGSAGTGDDDRDVQERVVGDLDQWLQHMSTEAREPDEHDLSLSEEIALAQGFKYAANRRKRHPNARPDAQTLLAERALQMLKCSRYWFSQLTLIHALCLWSLHDEDDKPAHGHGSRPRATVEYWLDCAGSARMDTRVQTTKTNTDGPPHPFVAKAAELAMLALETRQPERFCWIDESGVVSLVGSRLIGPSRGTRKHHLWIPPSIGWSALDPRAQQLVADVLLLLNLAERGGDPKVLEQRLQRANRPNLPACLTRDREPLAPGRTVGMADMSAPGTNCADGCAFQLCPYPPKGTQPQRVELSEAFCRRQRTLLSKTFKGRQTGSWQGIPRTTLKKFWTEMAERARGAPPRTEPWD
jgi:hypothetical protein